MRGANFVNLLLNYKREFLYIRKTFINSKVDFKMVNLIIKGIKGINFLILLL